jgi:tRNA-specific 2-thiouridylase
MSGGVDSSVVAALLRRAGHDVIGITLQLYDHGAATGRKGSCCAGQDIHDARRVAAALGIPHYVLDYEARFAATVMGQFADSYAAGETPVPCVACNQQIKFGDLLQTARELAADVLATGHYIQRRDGAGGPELYRAVDAERDQSYFLFATTRAQLASLWFPIGGRRKAEVRGLAREFALPVADKADSQDICFVPTGRYTEVVEKLRPGTLTPGDIVHVDGRRLGRHDGVVGFTVGQRRGLGIAAREPLYVVRLDARRNEVVVGPRDALRTKGLIARNVNWLGEGSFEAAAAKGLSVHVRVRSSQVPQPAALLAMGSSGARVILNGVEDGVAAGQACVFYADGSAEARVLGGGWIARTLSPAELSSEEGGTPRVDRRTPAAEPVQRTEVTT